METSRRSFLKLFAAAGAVAAVPSAFSLVEPGAPTPDNQRFVGMVREIKQYDIARGGWMVRYDIKTADLQIGVDAFIEDLAQIETAREPALVLLSAEMEHRGISVADLVELPSANF